ncbi:MAG TPA: GlcNAc-transferase family protein [Candidatus Acidoferrales bacterium]
MYLHDELIFVSLAAYRDPQLLPTIQDCIRKASNPARLRFGICWQREAEDPPLLLGDDTRFRVLDVHWRESRGACWARAEIMKLWQDENWFLQVDSHCRFTDAWDAVLLRTMTETGSDKPILSTYAAPFTPGEREILQGGPFQMLFQQFTSDGIPQLRPGAFPLGRTSRQPFRARFLSAGFLFAPGRFVEEVPYDPQLYFMGEESAMTVRAFTHGYDLFHPAETIVWHDYIRADASKHWGDHSNTADVPNPWSKLDEMSRIKVRRLLLGESVESFGLGQVRTLNEYEAYAGLSFQHRKVQGYTMRGEEPPNPDAPADWPKKIYPWIATIRFTREQIPDGSLADPMLWSLSILDGEGNEVCHRDVSPEDLAPLANAAGELAIVCEFPSETIPANWTLWPLTRSGQWLPKFGGRLSDEDFAILSDDD